MARSVPEWIGKDDNARPPKSVRMRVFLAHGGLCHITKRAIRVGDEWDLEHVRPLIMARPGENLNRESNLAPALRAPHRLKTAAEAGDQAKADRLHAKHFGYWPESRAKIQSRGFGETRAKPRERSA